MRASSAAANGQCLFAREGGGTEAFAVCADGTMRLRPLARAALPDPAQAGDEALAVVDDGTAGTGPRLHLCDGAAWRPV